jgi:hypothetical protein
MSNRIRYIFFISVMSWIQALADTVVYPAQAYYIFSIGNIKPILKKQYPWFVLVAPQPVCLSVCRMKY